MPTLVGGSVTVGASAGRAHGEDGRGTSSSPLPRLPPPLPFSSSFLSSSFFLFLLFFPSPFLPFPFLSFSSFFFLLLPSSSYCCFLLLLPSRRQEQGRTGPARAGEDSRARRRWQHARTAAAGHAYGHLPRCKDGAPMCSVLFSSYTSTDMVTLASKLKYMLFPTQMRSLSL